MNDMNDDIGYKVTGEDIEIVVRWLKINDPENANPTFARQMLESTRSMFRAMGQINEDLLHKALEDYKTKKDKN